MKANPGAEIRVEGHSDNTGNPAQQAQVAKRRAERVQAYLERKGIEKRRVLTNSFGARRPLREFNPNSEEGRRNNRRVDITVVRVK